jgi:hypothetical protein
VSQTWIQTYSGIKFDILDPQPDMICIEDIAHATSQANRFTGHCRFPYPVSQHSRLGSYIVPDEFALEFLMHDASEGYIGDMNRPMKHFSIAGDEYRKVETKVQSVICFKYGLPQIGSPIVKKIDDMMLYAEKAQLMPTPDTFYTWNDGDKTPADVIIRETSFYENKQLFLNRFFQLYTK